MRRRAVRIELMRLLRDPALVACLGAALLPATAIVAGLPDARTPAASGIVDPAVTSSLLAQSAVLAAVCGAVRTAAAYRTGVVARDALALRIDAPFWMRVASSALVGAAVALITWALARLGARLIRGIDLLGHGGPDVGVLAAALVLGVAAGIWGAAIGAIVRAPLAVLPVAAVSLSSAMLLSSSAPEVARALPLGAALESLGAFSVSAGGAEDASRWWSVLVAILWLIGALGMSFAGHRMRPLLG